MKWNWRNTTFIKNLVDIFITHGEYNQFNLRKNFGCRWTQTSQNWCQMSQPHFEASVKMRLTLPKMGTWSPSRLPQFQNSIVDVKTPCLEVFFISLERPWSVDVENGLAWAIWTSVAQIMVKRKDRNQIGNLTPDHKKSGIDPIPMCVGGVQHAIGKILRRATSLL
jgi:hypothetical protein